jgi:hypothetical protein
MRARNGYRGPHEFASGTRTARLPWPERRRLFRRRQLDRAQPPLSKPPGLPARLGAFEIEGALRWQEDKVLIGRDASLKRQVYIWLRPAGGPLIDAARLQLNRSSRLRWLTRGRDGDMQWDAFLAPSGCPLHELLRTEGRLSWAQAQPMLRDLTDELMQASKESTVPSPLGVEQIWVQPNGQIQLLESWIETGATKDVANPAPTDEDRALACLGQAAALMLEGRLRSGQDSPAPVRAPVPLYAGEILDPLLANREPRTSLEKIQAGLAETRDRPREINKTWRAAHLLILAIVLFFPAFLMFGMPIVTTNAILIKRLLQWPEQLQRAERTQKELSEGSLREFLAGSLNPNPTAALAAAALHDEDLRLANQVRMRMDREKEFQDALLRAAGPLSRGITTLVESNPNQRVVRIDRGDLKSDARANKDFREAARRLAKSPDEPLFSEQDLWVVTFGGIAFFPIVWVAWAFIARGGVTLRLMGIQLLRANGRKALRIQCAWRALLMWAPVCGLLGAASWLLLYYWSVWSPETRLEWMYRVSWVLWGLALALLPSYAVLAIRSPGRSVHDRLAGTYLVPR